MQRDYGIDHIRILLTILVIFHHVAIVYGGAGDWYWTQANAPKLHLVAFNTINQSFFMGFFFLLSGYFARASIDKKGAFIFIKVRLIRLGIPLLVYFFVISPFTVALAGYRDSSLLAQTITVMKAYEFEPGPLWFVFTLILLSCVLFSVYARFPKFNGKLEEAPNFFVLLVILLCIGLFTFFVRQFIPVGETFIWLQLGYFPMYIVLFGVGVYAYPERALYSIKLKTVTMWLPTSLGLIAALPFLMIYKPGDGDFEGGMNLNALLYALWEPLTACGIILSSLYLFTNKVNKPKKITLILSPLAYCMFIIHPPVVVSVSRFLSDWITFYPINIILNASASVILCAIVSWLILKLPYVSRVI